MTVDHDTAVKSGAAERYALDEMAEEERAAFESHYFECPDCATEVKAAVQFVTNTRVWFQEQRAPAAIPEPAASRNRPFWNWLRPVWLSPALATIFAAFAGYSWLVTIPRLRVQRAAPEAVEVFRPVLLRSELRGEQAPVIQVTPRAPLAVTLSIDSEREFPGYEVEVLNGSGAAIFRSAVPAWPTITLRLPQALLGNGMHTIVVRGGNDGHPEIGRYRFQVIQDPK